MTNTKELQLKNQRAIYTNFLREGRQDAIAEIVLERMQREINELERKINEKTTRNKCTKHKNTRGVISNVREIMHRSWHYKNRWHCKLFEIFTGQTPKKEGFVR